MSTSQRGASVSRSLRERKQERTRRMIQAEALRLFTEKGFEATTVEEIAAAAEVAPRTFFRYFATKDEVVFWPEYQPLLAGFVAARPAAEPAVDAVCHAIVDGMGAFYEQDREAVLKRLQLAFRTPKLRPRLWQQQARSARGVARVLAARLEAGEGELEIRAVAGAIAAALWVAVEEWQAEDGKEDLAALIERALGTVTSGGRRLPAAPKQDSAYDREGSDSDGRRGQAVCDDASGGGPEQP